MPGWEDLRDEWLEYLSSSRKEKTLKDIRRKIEIVERYYLRARGELPDPRRLKVKDVYGLLNHIITTYDPNYANRIYGAFLEFLGYCLNPYVTRMKYLRPKRVRKPIDYYGKGELERTLWMFGERPIQEFMMKVLIWLYAFLGLRYFEPLRLRWCDVDFENNKIHIVGKGGHERYAVMPDMVKDLLLRYREAHEKHMNYLRSIGMETTDYLFFRETKEGAVPPSDKDRSFFRRMQRRAEKIGLRKFNVKMYRSTLIKKLLDKGIPTDLVASQVGHSSPRVTWDHYARMPPDRIRDSLEEIAEEESGEVRS